MLVVCKTHGTSCLEEAKRLSPEHVGEVPVVITAPGQSGVSKIIQWVEKAEASGSEGGCAYGFVSKGHTVCSPTDSKSSLGRVGEP